MKQRYSPAIAWLTVSIISMMFMGIYAFLVALSRVPGFNMLFTDQNFFKTALVTHVVLSVVIWFIAYILFVTYHITDKWPTGSIDYAPAIGAALGVAMIVATPFTGSADPILNNYIPVLNRSLYLYGVWVFILFAIVGMAIRAKAVMKCLQDPAGPPVIITGSIALAGLALLIGAVCIVMSYFYLAPDVGSIAVPVRYEALFWGGGHVLQFTNTLGLMAVWGLLASKVVDIRVMEDKVAYIVLITMALFTISAPVQYFKAPLLTVEHRQLFTSLKSWGVATGPIVMGALILIRKFSKNSPVSSRGLYLSIWLFGLGGAMALMIQGSDTRVPAHYHGVIGAVTLSFMAYALVHTAENGWLNISEKWQKIQLTLYGVGQTLFVIGLFVGGSEGLPRKTFGTAQNLDSALKVTGMSVMGIGGLLAVAGGVMFILFMLKALFGKEKR